MLPQINSYLDLMKKLEYDRERYRQNTNIFELLDCLLTLNSLPEWIAQGSEASEGLKAVAEEKIKIMRGFYGFEFNEDKLDSDIDQKLRFIRMTCNHTKHKKYYPNAPVIKSEGAFSLPAALPAALTHYLVIGSKQVTASLLVDDVTAFWKYEISKDR